MLGEKAEFFLAERRDWILELSLPEVFLHRDFHAFLSENRGFPLVLKEKRKLFISPNRSRE